LRFPEFTGEWEEKKLSDIAEKNNIKNRDGKITNVISNSAQHGLIPQLDFFDREIANDDNTGGYFIIENGDFVYNPRKSTTAPYGPVNIYLGRYSGIVSPLYLCFRTHNINRSFLFHYFRSSAWYRFMYLNGDSGARHDRVSIKDELFFTLPIKCPKEDEQEKNARFLSLLDERIATQSKIIEKLESLIKGLYSATKRESWTMHYLRDVLEERDEQNIHEYPVFSVAVRESVINQIEHLGRSFAAKNTRNYNVVQFGDIVYTKSPTGDFPYGIVKQSSVNHPVAVSPLYGVYKPKNLHWGNILHHYFLSPINANNYLHSLIQKGAKNTINITSQHFLDKAILLPTDEIEIKNISLLLKVISKKIHLEKDILRKLEVQKTVLLQSMFI
jgi:type I restriction enzyme S subunit